MDTMWKPQLDARKGPKYQQLYSALKEAVDGDLLKIGEKLPPIREIAFLLHMTPSTVVRAYQMGIDNGFLEARVGDGTYVKSLKSSWKKVDDLSYSLFDNPQVSGYNLRSQAIIRVGQDQLATKLLTQLLAENKIDFTRYTCNDDYVDLQKSAAKFLCREGFQCLPEHVVLTHGATNATSIAARVIAHEGRSIKAMTEPECYVGFRDVKYLGSVELLSIEADELGMRPDKIREACEKHHPNFLMTSSVIQNPYATTMSVERMSEIAALAREFDFQIIDDVLHAHLTEGSLQTLRDFAPERVWMVTSLSKLGYPAVQFGMMLPPLDRVREVEARIGLLNIRPSELQRPLVEALLASNEFYALRDRTRDEIAARHEIVREELAGFDFQITQGSPYLWLKLPDQWPASRFIFELSKSKISVASSDTFSEPSAAPNAVRITMGGPLTRADFKFAIGIVRGLLETQDFRQDLERVV